MYAIQPVMNTQRMVSRVMSEPWFKNKVSPKNDRESTKNKIKGGIPNGQVSINMEPTNKDPKVVSPLEAIACLLRVYCFIGIIPGRLNVDCCSITTKCWLNIKIFVVLISLLLLHTWAESDVGETKEQTAFYRELKNTRTDEAVRNMYWVLAGFFFIASLIVNHRNLGQVYRVATMLAQPGMARFDSPRAILTHHAVYVFLYGSRTIAQHFDLIVVGYTKNEDNFDIKVGWFMVGCFIKFVLDCYIGLIFSVAELVIGRFMQCCSSLLATSLEELNSRRISPDTFISRTEIARLAYGKLAKAFGNSMFLLIMSSLVYMIWQSYSVISVLFRGTTLTIINDGLIMTYHGIMVFLAVKRLMHLTGLVHEFRKRIDDVSEKLIDYEVDPSSEYSHAASRSQFLLSRIDGLSVRGFFLVDRHIFPSIIGFFLTYLVLLIEFRISDQDETQEVPI